MAPQQPPQSPRRPHPRVRLLAPIAAATLAVVAVIVLALSLSSSTVPPATGAASLVPADALLYLHFSTDQGRPAVRRALTLAGRFPDSPLLAGALTGRLDAILSGSSGATVDFSTQVRPWLGKEAALAVLDTASSTAGSLIVLDVRDRRRVRAFLAGVGATRAGTYRGVTLYQQPSGTVLAMIRHYLALGQAASVQAAIDVAEGKARSLAGSRVYRSVAGSEPADRFLDAYASAAGTRRALLPRGGLIGALAALIDRPGLRGTAISLSAQPHTLSVIVHSSLDPRLSGAGHARAQFAPTLAGVLPAGSTMLLDVKRLATAAPGLLATGDRLGIAEKIGPLLARLGGALRAEGVDMHQVLSIFSGETAIALAPGGAGHGPAPVVITRTPDEPAARALLAGLEVPLTQLFAPPGSGPGQAPVLSDVPVPGATVHQLALAPGFELDYAVSRHLVVVSTSLAGIAGVFAHRRALGDAARYQTALENTPDQVTSLLFFDFNQLLRLGEQTGLISSARLATLWPDLLKIRTIGLTSTRGESDTTTELRLQIP